MRYGRSVAFFADRFFQAAHQSGAAGIPVEEIAEVTVIIALNAEGYKPQAASNKIR